MVQPHFYSCDQEKDDPTLGWTCQGCREEPAAAHPHGMLIPLGLGAPRTQQGHFLGLFLPECWEEVTLSLLVPKNKAWRSWSQSSCKHLGVCSQQIGRAHV